MVSFYLRKHSNGEALYEYYPHGNRARKGGLITADLLSNQVFLTESAECDTAGDHALRVIQNIGKRLPNGCPLAGTLI